MCMLTSRGVFSDSLEFVPIGDWEQNKGHRHIGTKQKKAQMGRAGRSKDFKFQCLRVFDMDAAKGGNWAWGRAKATI